MKKKKPMSRSENMSRIKSKNTEIEIYFRKLLWHKNFRYRKNYNKLVGKPDIYISKYKTAIFINGCFWHMHTNCKKATIPKKNHDFWKNKLERNAKRDIQEYNLLKSEDINVIVVWECEIKKMMRDKEFEKIKLNEVIQKIINKG